jgi:hypothetical protein
MPDEFLVNLNITLRQIANKYRELKMKSTMNRELKGLEVVKMETNGFSTECLWVNQGGACWWFGCW